MNDFRICLSGEVFSALSHHGRSGRPLFIIQFWTGADPSTKGLIALASRGGALHSSPLCSRELSPDFRLRSHIPSLCVNDAITIWLALLSKRYKSPSLTAHIIT